MTVELNEENFEVEVTKSKLPVLVDFWAPWCGPCTTLEPVIDLIAKDATDFKVARLNVMAQRKVAQQYSVSNVPTLMTFHKGQVVETLVGEQSKEELEAMIARAAN